MSEPTEADTPTSGPAWQEAAADFVSARMELLALEAREAANRAARKAAFAVFAVGCGMLSWLCFVAGVIGWIAAAGGGLPWHFVALGAAAFHLLLAGIAVALLRRPAASSFPLSRAELSKDREWLRTFQEKPRP